MSKYTTEVRYICEVESGLTSSAGYSSIEKILDLSAPKVFDFDFPIFDEDYRPVLERKILRHYYTREIGEETVGLWKLRLADKLNIIMPYYNKLYESELLEYDPLTDTDLTIKKDISKDDKSFDDNIYKNKNEVNKNTNSKNDIEKNKINKDTTINENEGTSDNEHKENSENKNWNDSVSKNNVIQKNDVDTDNNEWNLFSDTPQGGIAGIEAAYSSSSNNDSPNLSNNAYLTDARNIKNHEDVVGTSTNETSGFDRSTNKGEGKNESTDNTNTTTKGVMDSSGFEREFNNSNIDTNENNVKNESGFNRKQRNAKNLEDYLERITGKRGTKTYASMILELRQTFLNIDAMILDELSDLFLNLW